MGSKANTVKSKNVQSDTGKISKPTSASNLTVESKRSTSKGPKLTKEDPGRRKGNFNKDKIYEILFEDNDSTNTRTTSRSRTVGLTRNFKKKKE